LNDTRLEILMCLINNARMMKLSDIAEELDTTPQLVGYHLPFLLDMGLILEDDRRYFCQPAFIDQGVQQLMAENLGESVENFASRLHLDFERYDDRIEALINCLQIQMQLSIQQIGKLFENEEEKTV